MSCVIGIANQPEVVHSHPLLDENDDDYCDNYRATESAAIAERRAAYEVGLETIIKSALEL